MGNPNLFVLDELFPEAEELTADDLRIFKATKEMKLASLGRWGLVEIIKRERLAPFLEFFDMFNGAKDAPYHNEYHTTCMVLNCYEGAYHEQVGHEDRRVLVVAALFHDFNHSAGKLTDTSNIYRAITDGLNIGYKYAVAQGCLFTEKQLEQARQLIEITKYPYEAEPSTPLERITRDADLMQPYEDDPATLQKQYLGLKKEIEVKVLAAGQPPLASKEFAEKLRAWFENEALFYSLWGQEKQVRLNWKGRLDNLKELLAGV